MNNFKNGYLDGELLFKAYHAMGQQHSFERLQRWCLEQKPPIVNPATQTVPNRMGLWKSIWRWAGRNPDKAFEYYQVAYPDKSRLDFDTVLFSNRVSAYQTSTKLREFYAHQVSTASTQNP
jgi:hypothetical protein